MLDFLITVFKPVFFFEFILRFFITILHLFLYYFMRHHPILIPQKFKIKLHTQVF